MVPQGEIDLHRHDYLELVIVTHGDATHRLEKGSYRITRGDVFLVPVDVLHGYGNCNALHLMNVVFNPEALDLPTHQLLQLAGYRALFTLKPRMCHQHDFRSKLQLKPTELERCLAKVEAMRAELRAKSPGFEIVSVAFLSAVLVDLARSYDSLEATESQTLVRIAAVVEWLSIHFQEPLTLDDIVKQARMSPSSLRRSFRECFGTSPTNYLIDLRLRQAEHLLRNTNTRIRDIAPSVGIEDASYFSRLFRKRTGHDPSAYRAQHRGASEEPDHVER